jgi:hypothetical protein
MATYQDYINLINNISTKTREINSFSEVKPQLSSFRNMITANEYVFQTLHGVKNEVIEVIGKSKNDISFLFNFKEKFQNQQEGLQELSNTIVGTLAQKAKFKNINDSTFIAQLDDIERQVINIQKRTTLYSLNNSITEANSLRDKLNQMLGASEVLDMLEYSELRINSANKVSIETIKEKIKTQYPSRYDEMLILDEKKENYYVVKYEAKSLKRKVIDTKFYLHNPIKLNFNSHFIGGMEKYGKIQKFEGSLPFTQNDEISKNENTFLGNTDLPLYELEIKRNGRGISNSQPFFFIPEKTFKQNCSNCNGKKYLPCKSCNAQHKYRCDTCDNDGKVSCNTCNTSGKITCKKCAGASVVDCSKCDGKSFRKCSSCSGKGVNDKGERCHKCQNGSVRCTNCNNGKVRCEDGFLSLSPGCGGSGKVNCGNCKGAGKLICSKCNGERYLYCAYCHGNPNDGETYAKIDCEGCKASGELGFITYVSTDIINTSDEQIFLNGQIADSNKFILDNVNRFLHSPHSFIDIYYDVHNEHEDKNIETTQKFTNTFRELHNLKSKRYPKVLSEQLSFEAVPCSTFTYKHILSNTIHSFSVIGVDKEQEIIFHSDPKGTLENTSGLNNFGKKLFSSNSHKNKIDKRNELILMIYMAKADGIIEDREKSIIVSAIENLDNFTKQEQNTIFGMMNLSTLPPLDPKFAVFSSTEIEEEVKARLVEFLGNEDGKFEVPETIVYNKILETIQKARSKRGFFYYLGS